MACPATIGLGVINGSEVLYRQRIIRQFSDTDIIETTPYKVFLIKLFHIAGVYTVLHANFCATEHLTLVCKFSGCIAYGNTNTGAGTITPKSGGIEAYILTVHITYIGCPQAVIIRFLISIAVDICTVVPRGTGDNA